MRNSIPRRRFLKTAALAAAAAPLAGRAALGAASERVRLGFIGCGGRARQMMPMFLSAEGVEIAAVSDVIEPRMDQAIELLGKGATPRKPERVLDYRRILDRKDVDAVVIATTQHWHGLPHILACRAGKAVFVEKPLSHTVREGRAMVAAAAKHGVLAVMGTQQRAGPHYRKAVEIVRSGKLGKVALVECWNYSNTKGRTGKRPDSDPPPGYHWDEWLGPAPKVSFNWGRLDSSWWFDYGGGMLTNWAVHHIDIILWAMGAPPLLAAASAGGKLVVDDIADAPDTVDAVWEFPGWLLEYRYRGFSSFHPNPARPSHHGIAFHGSAGTLVIDRTGYELWEESNPKQVAEKVAATPYFDAREPMRSEQDGPWQRLFIDCVRGGKKPPVTLEESHRATVCCHLANIAYLSGRKIRWDGEAESIPGDAEAARLLERPRRAGYELPGV
jgi:predicted dehydrogenase